MENRLSHRFYTLSDAMQTFDAYFQHLWGFFIFFFFAIENCKLSILPQFFTKEPVWGKKSTNYKSLVRLPNFSLAQRNAEKFTYL